MKRDEKQLVKAMEIISRQIARRQTGKTYALLNGVNDRTDVLTWKASNLRVYKKERPANYTSSVESLVGSDRALVIDQELIKMYFDDILELLAEKNKKILRMKQAMNNIYSTANVYREDDEEE
jgi:hypothetical protein